MWTRILENLLIYSLYRLSVVSLASLLLPVWDGVPFEEQRPAETTHLRVVAVLVPKVIITDDVNDWAHRRLPAKKEIKQNRSLNDALILKNKMLWKGKKEYCLAQKNIA